MGNARHGSSPLQGPPASVLHMQAGHQATVDLMYEGAPRHPNISCLAVIQASHISQIPHSMNISLVGGVGERGKLDNEVVPSASIYVVIKFVAHDNPYFDRSGILFDDVPICNDVFPNIKMHSPQNTWVSQVPCILYPPFMYSWTYCLERCVYMAFSTLAQSPAPLAGDVLLRGLAC